MRGQAHIDQQKADRPAKPKYMGGFQQSRIGKYAASRHPDQADDHAQKKQVNVVSFFITD